MNSLAGIIYPDTFQKTKLIRQIFPFLEYRVPTETRAIRDIYHHKTVELGLCGKSITHDRTKRLSVGLDGFITNLADLKSTLKKKGYPLENQQPEGFILQAYEEWGPRFLEYLEGDFALFVYDAENECLLLARDRVGKKPLYWGEESGYFCFCSTLKGILATKLIPQTIDNDALAAYFSLGYFPQDMTPIVKINKLLPGHYLLLTQDGSKMINPYWSYSAQFEQSLKDHRNVIAHKLDQLLDAATQKNIVASKANIGAFLTGGLGSSTVAYYLKKNSKEHSIEGFTTCFKKESEKDFEIAQQVAGILDIPQQVQILTQENFLDDFTTIMWYLDEPVADPNVISYWKMAEAASTFSSEIFSGMGCDELLAGHSRYSDEEQHSSLFMDLQNRLRTLISKHLVPIINKIHRTWAYDILKHTRKNIWQSEYLKKNLLIPSEVLQEMCPQLFPLFDAEVFVSKFYNLLHISSPISSYIYFDVKTMLPDLYILEVERVTSAFSLQWHTPFLDKSVIEFSASIPIEKILPEKDTASPLKSIIKSIFPESFVNRPKRRRPDFLTDWIETSDLHLIFYELTKGTLVETGVISEEWIQSAVRTPESRKENFTALWAILALEVWFRLYINKPITHEPVTISVIDLLQES